MPYNKDIHHRRSIRLKDYDYSQSGLYFVTICTQDRDCRLGNIVNGEMVLNELGNEINNIWKELPNHFPNIECDIYQIMPNHIHGIIIINKLTNASDKNVGIGDIVCAFKSLSVVRCLKKSKSRNETLGKLWQRNYYEHIIRTPQEHYKIANYIISNPYNWTKDELFEE